MHWSLANGILQERMPREREDLNDIYECSNLGFFERIKMLLDQKVIDMATVDRLFGFRFFYLVNNPHVQRMALYPDGHSFTATFALHRQWLKYRPSNQT